MTNLVPEQRVDKNNKLVTRHVRPVDNSNPPALLPAPIATSASSDRERLLKVRQEALEAIEDMDHMKILDAGSYYDHLRQAMNTLDEETALMVRDSVTTQEMALLCLHLVSDFSSTPQDIKEVLYYRNAIAYTTEPNDSGYNFSDESVGLVRGIRNMKEFQGHSDLTRLSETQSRQVSALLRVGYAVHYALGASHPSLHDSCKWGVGSRFPLRIQDNELVKLVMNDPSQDELICALIKDRRTADAALVKEFLNTSAPALVKGAL